MLRNGPGPAGAASSSAARVASASVRPMSSVGDEACIGAVQDATSSRARLARAPRKVKESRGRNGVQPRVERLDVKQRQGGNAAKGDLMRRVAKTVSVLSLAGIAAAPR